MRIELLELRYDIPFLLTPGIKPMPPKEPSYVIESLNAKQCNVHAAVSKKKKIETLPGKCGLYINIRIQRTFKK